MEANPSTQARLQTRPDPANVLRTLGQNGPVGPLPKSRPTETIRDTQHGFKPLSLGGGCE